MRTSESINEIAAALAKAQGEMGAAVKDAANPFFKSKYADLASVWDACRAPLTKNGLSVAQFPTTEYSGRPEVYTWTSKSGETRMGIKVVCIVSVVTRLLHSSGQWLEDTASAMLATGDPQAVGSAITYLRRYSLQSVAGVAPEDDDAERTVQAQPKAASVVVEAPATPDVELPPGAVLIKRVEQFKATTGKPYWTVADHKNVTYKEWDQRRASMLEQFAQNRVPVVLAIKETKWGRDITAVSKAETAKPEPTPEPVEELAADSIPF